MDKLHTVIRSIKSDSNENKRRDHLDVFREFLAQMDRAAKRKPAAGRVSSKSSGKSSKSGGSRKR